MNMTLPPEFDFYTLSRSTSQSIISKSIFKCFEHFNNN